HAHAASVVLVHAGEDLDQRRLAGPVVAEDARHLARVDMEGDVLQRQDVAEVLGHVLELEQVGAVGLTGRAHLISPARPATGSPSAPKIQLPKRMPARTQAATTVSPSNHRVATLSPYFSQTVEAKTLWANENPEAWSMSLIETPPVILIVSPALIPRSMKKVPSVTMKLGSLVLTTVRPLRKPIARPNSRHTTTAGQRPQW